ncbi:hypothetical protein V6N13_006278 [Hibiscus sabdariffa]
MFSQLLKVMIPVIFTILSDLLLHIRLELRDQVGLPIVRSSTSKGFLSYRLRKAPLVQDPPTQDPPFQDPPVRDPPIPDVQEPVVDEAMTDHTVWRMLQRVGGSPLEAPKTTISKRLLAPGTGFFDGVSEASPNLAKLWLDHIDRVLYKLDYPMDQRLKAYTSLLKDQTYNWWGTVQRNTPMDQLTLEFFEKSFGGGIPARCT